jgi:hypothetical protein
LQEISRILLRYDLIGKIDKVKTLRLAKVVNEMEPIGGIGFLV